MKIATGSLHPAAAQQAAEGKGEKASQAAAKTNPVKPAEKGDSVELSEALESELKNRQAEQAKRVEAIRELVKSGRYRVSSRQVAEKMLAETSGD